MRVVVLVVMLLSRTALADRPNGYACAPGNRKADLSGCACPSGYADHRDGENNAVCVVSGPNYRAQFLKALADNDLAKAEALGVKIDASTDLAVAAAITRSLDAWVAKAKVDATAFELAGRCAKVMEGTELAFAYWRVWKAVMEQSEKRNPKLWEAVDGRFDLAVKPLMTLRDCAYGRGKPERNLIVEEMFAKARTSMTGCTGNVDTTIAINMRFVVDADGVAVGRNVALSPSPKREIEKQVETCTHDWLKTLAFPRDGSGYVARISMPGGKGAAAISYACAPGFATGDGCTCPQEYINAKPRNRPGLAVCQAKFGMVPGNEPTEPTTFDCAPGQRSKSIGCSCPAGFTTGREAGAPGKAVCRKLPVEKSYEHLIARAQAKDGNLSDLYEAALKLEPNGVEALFGLATMYAANKESIRADSYFNKVLKLDPTYEPALWGKAEVHRVANNRPDAIAAYRAYLAAHPGSQRAKEARQALDTLERR